MNLSFEIVFPDRVVCCGPKEWGTIVNRNGFKHEAHHSEHRMWPFSDVTIYEITLLHICPLTYVLPDGTEIQPDRHYFSDDGSMPPLLDSFIVKSDDYHCRPGFLLHDSPYHNGGYWWVKHPGETEFHRVWMPKVMTDRLLACACMAGGEDQWRVRAIYAGVCMNKPFTHYGTPERVTARRRLSPRTLGIAKGGVRP